MSASFLSSAARRAFDADPQRYQAFLRGPASSSAPPLSWRVDEHPRNGRRLVATRAIEAGAVVFEEGMVATGVVGDCAGLPSSEAHAVALAALRIWQEAPDSEQALALRALQQPARASASARRFEAGVSELQRALHKPAHSQHHWCTRDDVSHALGLAVINAHGGRSGCGAVGLLSSMLEHECDPNAYVCVGDASFTLCTLRDVGAGESLTISYVRSYLPTASRRRHLLEQHGFVCMCARCTDTSELVRAFRCPNCAEGPCSPSGSGADCRELVCDGCDCVLRLDDDAWHTLVEAERSDTLSAEVMSVLHPYHHKPLNMYRSKMSLVSSQRQRADIFVQLADARVRLLQGSTRPYADHPLVALDLECAAECLAKAGDDAAAATQFEAAAACYAACYGAASADTVRSRARAFRCTQASFRATPTS